MYVENANVVIISDFIAMTYWVRGVGPYRIATELRKHGYTCQVIDCFTEMTEEEQFATLSSTIGPDTKVVALSSTFYAMLTPGHGLDMRKSPSAFILGDYEAEVVKYTFDYFYSHNLMQRYFDHIRACNPKTKIMMAGSKASALTATGVDVVLTGLGDNAIIEYLKFLDNKNPFFSYTIHNNQMVIDGNKYHEKFDFRNSQIIYEPCDNILNREVLTIEVGRGCIFKCKYCAWTLNGKTKNDYIKHTHVLREELIRNYEEYGITRYYYSDDTHNDNTEKLRALADLAQSLPFKLEYFAYIRVDLLRAHPEQYQLLKDGGLAFAFFGIETLNHEVGKLIGKGLHPDKTVEELYRFKDKLPHVGTESGFICGLPKETKESMFELADRLLDPNFPLEVATMYPLVLNKYNNHDSHYLSEFEKDSEKWFTFDPDDINNWHNGNFDRNWATQFSVDYKRKQIITQRRRYGGTAFATYNLFPDRDIIGKCMDDVNFISLEEWFDGRRGIRRRYIDSFFSTQLT